MSPNPAGAIIGAVVGTVSASIQCTAPGGGGSCTKGVTTGFVGGAAVGAAAAAGGIAAADVVGGGFAGAVAGGAVGGAIGGAGNYATQAFVNGSGVSWSGAWDATWKGAAAGAIGGAAGSVAGNYMAQGYAQMVGGFAGGTSGSALNGGSGWQILQNGLMGAGMAYASGLLEDVIDPIMFSDFNTEETSLSDINSINSDIDVRYTEFDKNGVGSPVEYTVKKPIESREMLGSERNIYKQHLEYINKNKGPSIEHLTIYQKEKMVFDFVGSESRVENVAATRYLRFHTKDNLSVIHNQPGGWLPSNNDYRVAGMYNNNRYYIIQTNKNVPHQGMYKFSNYGEKRTIQYLW